MALIEYTPQRILTTENMSTKSVVTSEHWNEIINLLTSQGNNSATAIYNMLNAIAASTAAEQVGAATITGVTGTTVQTIMAGLKGLLDLCYTASATDTLLAQKESLADANQLVKSITFNNLDGKFTITKQDGTSSIIDTALEKVAINFTYDQATQSLILTLADGSTQTIPLSSLIQENDFVDSDTIDFTVTNHTITAVVKNASITEAMLTSATLAALVGYKNSAETAATNAAASEANSLTYKNNAATSAGEALVSKNAAKTSETNAKTSETNSKTSETNAKTSETNAATSASQALQYRNEASSIVGDKVISFNGRKDVVLPADGDYTAAMVGAIDAAEKGAASGVATLGTDSKVLPDQLPAMADTGITLSAAVLTALTLTGTKYVSDALIKLAPWKLLQAYTVAGSYNFTVPDGITELGVFIIGGGGSGSAADNSASPAVGGCSGASRSLTFNAPLSASYNLVVGAGGASVTGASINNQVILGNSGGTSSFNGISVDGGSGGVYSIQAKTAGQSPVFASGYNWMPQITRTPFAFGEVANYGSSNVYQQPMRPMNAINPFDNKRLLIAGGTCAYNNSNLVLQYAETVAISDDYGNSGSVAAIGSSNTVTATKGTSYGCGGGAAYNETAYKTAVSAAGCDGAVLVYGR